MDEVPANLMEWEATSVPKRPAGHIGPASAAAGSSPHCGVGKAWPVRDLWECAAWGLPNFGDSRNDLSGHADHHYPCGFAPCGG